MNEIIIRGIRATGHHGVFEHERVDGQEFVVDLVIVADFSKAAASDDLVDTVDYGALALLVTDHITGAPLNLIETLAVNIAASCMDVAGVLGVEVTVHKPHAPIEVPFDDVLVRVRRGISS